MATRNTAAVTGRPDKGTEFQLHSSSSGMLNVIDFTERKLIKYASKVTDLQQKMLLMALIEDYRRGRVAVAWRRGRPVHLPVTKET